MRIFCMTCDFFVEHFHEAIMQHLQKEIARSCQIPICFENSEYAEKCVRLQTMCADGSKYRGRVGGFFPIHP